MRLVQRPLGPVVADHPPRALTDAVMGADPAVAKRAFDAMMTMKKIGVAVIEAVGRGEAHKYIGRASEADNVRR